MNLSEIAQRAGVSPATVSLVLNNKKGVGALRRREITRLLLENGYTISEGDRSQDSASRGVRFLKYTRHALLVQENPGFVSAIIDSIERECRHSKYELMITAVNSLEEVARYLAPRGLGGVLLLGTELDDRELFPFFREARAPLVVVDNALHTFDCAAVTMNNRAAIFSAVEHLLGLGHEKIGFLANSQPGGNCEERRLAFLDAAERFSLKARPVIPVNMTMDGAHASLSERLSQGLRLPPALIANNDSIAVGAIRALKEAGLSVPGDLSVVGFDNIPFSGAFAPPLTTLAVPCQEIGTLAVRMLLERVRDPLQPPYKALMSAKLIVRGSTRRFSPPRRHPNLME